MSPEGNLNRLLAAVSPLRHPGVYVFCELLDGRVPEGISPLMTFREGDTTTVVVMQDRAQAAGLVGEMPSVWITLGVRSDLAAVGFLAVITARLAAKSISVNVVSACGHDHLFVPVAAAEETLAVLASLEASHQPIELVAPNDAEGLREKVEIHPARIEDAQALTELWDLCGLDFVGIDVVPEMQACLRLHAELVLVAVAGATITGSAWATYDGRRGWVQRLATRPEYRDQGIGSALLAEIELRLTGLGAKKVNLLVEPHNLDAVEFYRARGYQRDDLVFMERYLA